jgi:glycosyltransferase involved in cell wall biosynthesis
MKVTIGVPVRNCQAWIRESIQSALNQTWPEKEIVVVDDGSTDDTPRLCQNFGHQIRYFSQGKLGVSAARNRILREARGDWIQYLDADDYLLPEKLEAQLDSTDSLTEVDVILGSFLIETLQDGNAVIRRSYAINKSSNLLELWMVQKLPQIAGCLWKKTALLRIGGWDESLQTGEDYELYLRVLQANLRLHIVENPLAVWRWWSVGTLGREYRNQMCLVYVDLMKRCETWLKSQGRWTDTLQDLAERKRFFFAREIAKTDIELAAHYYQEQKATGSIGIDRSIAPWKYEIMLRFLGFKRAEQIARMLRSPEVNPT